MAVSETAKLIVDLSLKGNFARQMGASTKALDKFAAGESRAFKAGAQIGTGIRNAGRIAAAGIAVLTSQVALGLDSLIQLEKATAQTNAVIRSTGGAAGQTAKSIAALSEKYEAMNATVGDEFIQAGQNMLLTFTNIRKKAFEPALQAILDLNTAMGKGPEGLTSTAIQVGKALNDPAKGITALRRVGVAFTKAQEKKIKSLQKEGKLYEAQKLILAELNKEFGGSFAAQGQTTAGKVAKFKDSIDDLQRSLATALLPTLGNVADALSEFLKDPAVVRGAEELGVELGKMFSKENIRSGIDALRGIFNTAREVAPIVAAAAKTMGGFISAAVSAFKSLPPEIQALAVGAFAVNKLTGGLVTNIGGGLISAVLRQLKSAVVTVHGGVVNVSGVGGTPAKGGGLGAAITPLIGLTAALIALEETVRGAEKFGAINTDLGDKGLNSAEIAAVKYYQSSIAEQQLAAKRLGYIPTKADFDSAMVKLGKAVVEGRPKGEHTGAKTVVEIGGKHFDTMTKQYKAIEGVRRGIEFVHETTLDQKIIAANQARTAIETKASTDAGLLSAGLKAQRAGDTAASATRVATSGAASRITAAIRANRPITNVSVHVNATTVSKSVTVVSRYGPSGGSAQKDSRYGPQPT